MKIKKIYIECPYFIKDTKLNERYTENLKKTIFKEFENIKNGETLKINFKKIAERIDGGTFKKWIFLKTDEEIKKWNEIEEYAKAFCLIRPSFAILLIYNSLLKEKEI